jgi:hypothetical protein
MIVLLSYYSSPLHSLALRESFTVLFGLECMFSSELECSLVVIPVSFSGGRAWFYIWIKYANISVRSFQTSPQLDQLRLHKKIYLFGVNPFQFFQVEREGFCLQTLLQGVSETKSWKFSTPPQSELTLI